MNRIRARLETLELKTVVYDQLEVAKRQTEEEEKCRDVERKIAQVSAIENNKIIKLQKEIKELNDAVEKGDRDNTNLRSQVMSLNRQVG